MDTPSIAGRDDRAQAVRASVTYGFDALKKRLIRMLLNMGASVHDAPVHAHEALVETYVAAHRVVAPEAVFVYAATIAKRSLWRERRRVERSTPMASPVLPEEPALSDGPAAQLERLETLRVIGDAFAQLSPRDGSMVWQRDVDGVSCDELAQTHGLAPSSVPTVLHRSRGRLRGLLGPDELR